MRTFPSGRSSVVLLLVVVSLLLGACGTVALPYSSGQESPLFRLMSLVPNLHQTRTDGISFRDYEAIATAYPPAYPPKNVDEFTHGDSDSAPIGLALWRHIFLNYETIMNPADEHQNYDQFVTSVGFDYFAIQHYLNQSGGVIAFESPFEGDAVRNALLANGYAQSYPQGDEIWCHPARCERGFNSDIASRNMGMPFGGFLGRKYPVFVQPGLLVGASTSSTFEAMRDLRTSYLTELPEYREVIRVLTEQGTLLQAHFWDIEDWPILMDMLFTPCCIDFFDAAAARKAYANLREDMRPLMAYFETLPSYSVLAFADVVTDDEQVVEVAMAYPDQATAVEAERILKTRVAHWGYDKEEQTLPEVLRQQGIESVQTTVTTSGSTGQFVTLLSFHAPKPTPEQILSHSSTEGVGMDVSQPGDLYKWVLSRVESYRFNVLSTMPREDLEWFVYFCDRRKEGVDVSRYARVCDSR